MKMKRVSLLRSLVYGNKGIVLCVAFTLTTILDLLFSVLRGMTDISYWHLGTRFALCCSIALSLYIFKFFEKLPLHAILILHFGISILIMLGSVWITSLYSEIHPNAYRDGARTIIIVYPFIIVGGMVIDGIRTAKANQILKRWAMETSNDKGNA